MFLMVSHLPEIKTHWKKLVTVHHLPDIKNLVKAVRNSFCEHFGCLCSTDTQNILIELHSPYFYLLNGCHAGNFGPMSRGKTDYPNVYLCLFDT